MGWVYEYLRDELDEDVRSRIKGRTGKKISKFIRYDDKTLDEVEYGSGEPTERKHRGTVKVEFEDGSRETFEVEFTIRASLGRGDFGEPFVDYHIYKVSIAKPSIKNTTKEKNRG